MLNKLVCRCANFLVMANEIAGFGGSGFVFLVILSELTVQCVPK